MKKFCFALSTVLFLAACNKEKSETTVNEVLTDDMARPLSTMLTGAQEVPGPGDPDGSGMVHLSLNQGQGTITYHLEVSNIDPATGAHIHRAVAGQAGPVVVGLIPPTNGSSTGTATVSAELIKDIRQNPSMYYVNVHNAMYPAGAIRGQLSK